MKIIQACQLLWISSITLSIAAPFTIVNGDVVPFRRPGNPDPPPSAPASPPPSAPAPPPASPAPQPRPAAAELLLPGSILTANELTDLSTLELAAGQGRTAGINIGTAEGKQLNLEENSGKAVNGAEATTEMYPLRVPAVV